MHGIQSNHIVKYTTRWPRCLPRAMTIYKIKMKKEWIVGEQLAHTNHVLPDHLQLGIISSKSAS